MFIGNNLNGPTYYTNAWQFCDIMKNSTCWAIRGSEHEEHGCHWWWVNFTCPKCGHENKQVSVSH